MSTTTEYRKHYNPIYKLWEVQRRKASGIIADSFTWEIVCCRETESEADSEIEQASKSRKGMR